MEQQKDSFLLLELDIMELLIVCSDKSNQSLQVLLWDWTPTLCRCFTIQKCFCKVLSAALQLTLEISS